MRGELMGSWRTDDECTSGRIGNLMSAYQLVPDVGLRLVIETEVAPLLEELGYPLTARALKRSLDRK